METTTDINAINQQIVQLAFMVLNWFGVVVVPIILARITVWVKEKFELIKASQPKAIQEALDRAAKIGIAYVEQTWKDHEGDRLDKLDEAVAAARSYLEIQGYANVDTSALETTIEALLKSTKAEIKQNTKVVNDVSNTQYVQPL